MKPCEVCGSKKNGQLSTQLMNGPRGYRRYQACPICQRNAAAAKRKPGQEPNTQPTPTPPGRGYE